MNLERQYLDLLKSTLTDLIHIEYPVYIPLENYKLNIKQRILFLFNLIFQKSRFRICQRLTQSLDDRIQGVDRPPYADTMIGLKRLDNLEFCIREISKNKIEGDIIETGVWRGGACIYAKAILNILDENHRQIWMADSFQGLPKPNAELYPLDKGDEHYLIQSLAVSEQNVLDNFKKYNLDTDNIKILKGWFKDTLPTAPIDPLAIIRLDGDMYESTMDGLTHLYPKLAIGGYIIIDDWGAVDASKQAVLDYRSTHNIAEPIVHIDWGGVYWKRESE